MIITTDQFGQAPRRARQPRPTRRRQAFTLIELLAVLMIMMIVVALVVSVAGSIRDMAKKAATVASQEILIEAINAYYDAAHEYPPDRDLSLHLDTVSGYDFPRDSGIVLLQYLTGKHCYNKDGIVTTDLSISGGAPIKAAMERLRHLPPDALGPSDMAVKDAWRKDMRYEESGGLGDKPVIISAGPDHDFSTPEDNVRSDGTK